MLNRNKLINTYLVWGLLFSILILLLVVRVYRAKWGLPYLYHWDEPQIAFTALQILKTGNFNPNFFNYGTLPIYINYFVDIFHYLFLMSQPESAPTYLNSLSDIKTSTDTNWQWSISHPSFYYLNRLTSVVFGLFSIVITYLISLNVFGNKWVSLLAALFLGSVALHVEISAIIGPDIFALAFVLMSTLGALYFLDSIQTKYLIFSLVAAGCAIASKYNSALVLLTPCLSLLIIYCKYRFSFQFNWIFLLIVIPALTFFICLTHFLIAHPF